MTAIEGSWLVRRLGPAFRNSAVTRLAAAALAAGIRLWQLERVVAREGNRRLTRRDPPLTFAQLAPVASTSRLLSAVAALWRALDAAAARSRLLGAVDAASRASAALPAPTRIRLGALTVLAAATMHTALRLFVEPYPFPSRVTLIVPAVAAATALATWAVAPALARALAARGRTSA